MLILQIKTSIRYFLKKKYFSLLSLISLSLGTLLSLVIFSFVLFENTYDSFEGSQEIYRVQNNYVRDGEIIYNSAGTFAGTGPLMKEFFPQIKSYTRFYLYSQIANSVLQYKDRVFQEPWMSYVDPSFADFFNLVLVEGSRSSLSEPNKVWLSISSAEKYFGKEGAMGKLVSFQDETGHEDLLEVAGIFQDAPKNSHLKYDIVISYQTLYNRESFRRKPAREAYETDLSDYNFYTYISVSAADLEEIESRMSEFVEFHKPVFKETSENNIKLRRHDFRFIPVNEIHLTSHLQNEATKSGNRLLLRFLVITALLILIVAWVNYIAFSSANFLERSFQLRLQRIMGSSRKLIIQQFLVEAFLINLVSIAMAFFLFIVLDLFARQTGLSQLFEHMQHFDFLLPAILIYLLIASILVGVFPAFLLIADFSRAGKSGSNSGILVQRPKSLFRGSLVVVQFAISCIAIIYSSQIDRHLSFMMNADLGFDKENTHIIRIPDEKSGAQYAQLFTSEISQQNGVQSVGFTNKIPGEQILRGYQLSRFKTDDLNDIKTIQAVAVESSFLTALGVQFLAGRDFDHLDSMNLILNESAALELGFTDPALAVNATIFDGGFAPKKVKGVIKDYHQVSFKSAKMPMYYYHQHKQIKYAVIRTGNSAGKTFESQLEKIYRDVYGESVFDHFRLSDFYDYQYSSEIQLKEIFWVLTLVVIVLSCIGLIAFSTYFVDRREKEIGVRKTFGASTQLLITSFLLRHKNILVLGAIIGLPVSYYVTSLWRQNFEYNPENSVLSFFLPVALLSALALLSLSVMIFKACRRNPVDILRNQG